MPKNDPTRATPPSLGTASPENLRLVYLCTPALRSALTFPALLPLPADGAFRAAPPAMRRGTDAQMCEVSRLDPPHPLAAPRTPPEPRQAAPGSSPARRGTHRLLTGTLPGSSRHLHARHPAPPFAQQPPLSPPLRSGYGALWSARSAGALACGQPVAAVTRWLKRWGAPARRRGSLRAGRALQLPPSYSFVRRRR